MTDTTVRSLRIFLFAAPVGLMAAWIVGDLLGHRALAVVAAMSLAGLATILLCGASRREEVESRARTLAADLRFDSVTGLLTRHFLMEELRHAMRRVRSALPGQKRSMCLLLVDLDNFKAMNDAFGHKAGDQALAYFAGRMRAAFPHAVLGRVGGDEFAVLMEGATIGKAEASANALLHSVLEPAPIEGQQLQLGASIGVAAAPCHSCFAEDLLGLADLALYESKRGGRGCVTLFDEALLKQERHLRFVERELRAAVLLDHLDLHYQPLVDAAGRCVGVEALLRWNHPSLGGISPAEFVAVAERSTLIDQLGEWVLGRVCRDMPHLPGDCISFNVSGAQLQRSGFVDTVRRVIAQSGADPRRLVAEITENVAVSATPEVVRRLQALRAMGLRIALDDFGTGHCSFKTLRALPVDEIKLDRSYVSTLRADPVSRIFVSAVCETARTLGLVVVAEGVETPEEAALARAAGCHLLQGYLYRRPVPLAELGDLSRAAANDA